MNHLVLEVHVRLNGQPLGAPMTFSSSNLPQLDELFFQMEQRHRWELDSLKHELDVARRATAPRGRWWTRRKGSK